MRKNKSDIRNDNPARYGRLRHRADQLIISSSFLVTEPVRYSYLQGACCSLSSNNDGEVWMSRETGRRVVTSMPQSRIWAKALPVHPEISSVRNHAEVYPLREVITKFESMRLNLWQSIIYEGESQSRELLRLKQLNWMKCDDLSQVSHFISFPFSWFATVNRLDHRAEWLQMPGLWATSRNFSL